jgi:hypothetical protein
MNEGDIVLAPVPQGDGRIKTGIIGSISRERHQRLLVNLCRHLSP